MKGVLEFTILNWGDTLQNHRAKVCVPIESDLKNDVDQPVYRVGLQARLHFGFEVAVLPKELEKQCLRVFDVSCVVGPPGGIIRDLKQARIGEMPGARKFINAEVHGRL